jgi:ubiquinone/menaquinone biosynthesis C-methylase UbiE
VTDPNKRIWHEYSVANAKNPAQLHRWRLVVREVKAAASPGPVIVDLGCGSGALLKCLGVLDGATLIGVDMEPRALEIARTQVPEGRFYRADLDNVNNDELESLAGRADVVTCSEVLEHLSKPEAALDLAARLLHENGTLVVTVPSGPMNAFDRSIGHRRHYSVAVLSELLDSRAFRVGRCYTWGFPFHSAYRMAIGALPSAVEAFSDTRLTKGKRALFRFLDLLFHCNVRSSRLGRQLVAVASRRRT